VPVLDEPNEDRGPVDLRMPALGAAAWVGGLVGLPAPVWVTVCLLLVGAGGVLAGRLRGKDVRLLAGLLVVAGVVGAGALLRVDVVGHGPVAGLANRSAFVHARLTVTSDPVVREGRFSTYAVFRADVVRVTGRGRTYTTRAPVTVVADPGWAEVRLGGTLDVSGALRPSGDPDLAGLLNAHGDPEVVRGPGPVWVASAALRGAVRGSVAGRPLEPRALVPALVDGDDAGMPEETAEEFRVTGLTHLMAVSGTNLTLVVGFLLTAARWCGVRGRWLLLVGALGIAAFVVIARTEPSVLRAAAMGTVGLIALGANGRQRGSRALGVAVLLLLMVDPWLATSIGFALSVLATAGILFLAPGWRDALAAWLPRVVAEAVAVPLAAQLACTPVIAAISGQVSLVAVVANLVAAPAVGPATILGLLGGAVGLVVPPLGRVLGWCASWFAAWIIEVASRGAGLPTAAIGWGTGPLAIVGLTAGCVGLVLALPMMLRRPRTGAGCCALLTVIVFVPMPTPGWPPRDWVLVACDIGQGDGLVLNTGDGRAVVVDTGPDPALMDRCLDQLGVDAIPLVVLTHFHSDHVDGLAGVLDGRRVGEIDVTSRADPPEQADLVLRTAVGHRVRVPEYGETRVIGDVTLQVLAPVPGTVTHEEAAAGEGSGPNNASIVLLVEVAGIRLLLTGDVEPDAQRAIARAWPGLQVDVLKVAHHGSRYQYLPWLLGLGARLAVVSVGADNDYGHPSPETLGPLQAAGLTVYRTDQDGSVAISVVDGEIRVATHG